jgi:hypothetical protein
MGHGRFQIGRWNGFRCVCSYMAEISSLLDALLFITSSQLGEFLIFSDSLSLMGPIKYQRGCILLSMSARKCCVGCVLGNLGSPGIRWLTASLKMVQKVSSTTSVMHWSATVSRILNHAYCPNGKADGTVERWAGILFQFLLVCSSTPGFME